jgi:hypothetical protein
LLFERADSLIGLCKRLLRLFQRLLGGVAIGFRGGSVRAAPSRALPVISNRTCGPRSN